MQRHRAYHAVREYLQVRSVWFHTVRQPPISVCFADSQLLGMPAASDDIGSLFYFASGWSAKTLRAILKLSLPAGMPQ